MKSEFAHQAQANTAANLDALLISLCGQHDHRCGGERRVTPGMNGSAGMPSIRAATLPAVSILGPPDPLQSRGESGCPGRLRKQGDGEVITRQAQQREVR
jgi:hypothetical protein